MPEETGSSHKALSSLSALCDPSYQQVMMAATTSLPLPVVTPTRDYTQEVCRLRQSGVVIQSEGPPISMAADLVGNQADCSFIQKLPVEIRRRILGEAFGFRVVHIVHWKDWPTGVLHWSGGACKNPVLQHVSLRLYLPAQVVLICL